MLVVGFVIAFFLGVRYASNRIESGYDFLELEYAIDQGDLDAIERQLGKSASANVRSPDGNKRTVLHVAVNRDNPDAVKLLIEHGADPNAQSKRGVTPLHLAADNAVLARLLIEHGARVDLLDEKGRSPLHSAARVGNKEVVQLLISFGADIGGAPRTPQSPSGYSPALAALENRQIEMAKFLLFDLDRDNLEAENLEALYSAAAFQREFEMMRALVEAGADPNEALTWRVMVGGQASMAVTPLQSAVLERAHDAVRVMLELGTSPDETLGYTDTPIIFAVVNQTDKTTVELLLNHGLDIDIVDPETGETPLHAAIRNWTPDIAYLLIGRGADVNALTPAGKSPFDYAREKSNPHMLLKLLEHGTRPAASDVMGGASSPLVSEMKKQIEDPSVPPQQKESARLVIEFIKRFQDELGEGDVAVTATPDSQPDD